MQNKNLIMDPNRLKRARPDLWLVFLEILLEETPDFHEMITNSPTIKVLLEKLDGKLTFKVCELPERAQVLIYKATEEAKQRAIQNEKN